LASEQVVSIRRAKSTKILAVVPSPTCFGLQNLTLSLVEGVPDSVQFHFLTTYWTDGEFDRRLDALGIPHSSTWFGMFSRRLDRENVKMTLACLRRLPGAWLDFLRLYFGYRPDIIYLANHHEVLLLFPVLIWLKRKVICHMHDPPPPNRFQKISFFFWRRAVGRFIFISRDVRERLSQLGPLADLSEVIHNGVATAPLSEPRFRNGAFCDRFNWPADSVIFGMTGQISELKGHEDFLEAAWLVHQSNPNFRFVIGGRGDPGFVNRLREIILSHGMEAYVAFCGWLPRVGDFYEAIDVFVLASRHDEGFGLVVAEAGERGVATIATPSGGAKEILVEGETGLFVPSRAPHELSAAMKRLGGDSALRDVLGRNARRRVQVNFSLPERKEQFVSFLDRVANKIQLDEGC